MVVGFNNFVEIGQTAFLVGVSGRPSWPGRIPRRGVGISPLLAGSLRARCGATSRADQSRLQAELPPRLQKHRLDFDARRGSPSESRQSRKETPTIRNLELCGSALADLGAKCACNLATAGRPPDAGV